MTDPLPKMTDAYKELKRKRASCKGRITVFSNYLANLKSAELTACQVLELQLRIERLEILFNEFHEIQLQLECLSDNANIEYEERTIVESQYYASLAQAKLIVTSGNAVEERDDVSSHSNTKRQLLKLPTIKLPNFTGLYNNWLEFRDTFTSLIHDNNDIDVINKFHYLRSSLTESAAMVIHSIEFSAQNYTVAWELLCERYNNSRLLVHNHLSALFDIEPITKESSASLKCLIDQVNKNLRALSTLGEPVQHWDTILIHIISKKLDSRTFREWEEYKGQFDKNKSIPFDKFLEFMRNRADLIETVELSRQSNISTHKQNTKIKAMVASANHNSISHNSSCPKCNGDHNLNVCPQFLTLSVNERLQSLRNYKVCYNCFRHGHYPSQCKKPACKICKRKHHTLIHNTDFKREPTVSKLNDKDSKTESSIDETQTPQVSFSVCAQSSANGLGDVLLSTALIKCYDADNKEHIARALLDSGSSSCVMTEKLFDKLKLPYQNINKSIQGINNSISFVKKLCRVHIQSLNESYSNNLLCLVLPTISDSIPAKQVLIDVPTDIQLADPYFHTPSTIDLIIGADVFWSLLGAERIFLGNSKPTLQETRLGWLISGPINHGMNYNKFSHLKCNFSQTNNIPLNYSCETCIDDIQNQLTRFWQLEEVSHDHEPSSYSPEEKSCEEHFLKNMSRLSDGRFCVRIPLKESLDELGDSFNHAKRCFLSIERRNKNQPSLDRMYKDFMSEYIALGHMSESVNDTNKRSYFIPHHGILRESSLTTKLRVVFNASAPTTSGLSLNKIQMVGPTVQDDLSSILLRFRMYKYVFCADVEKMYRQVLIHPSDRHLQKIIWRDNLSSNIKTYKLNTVTYGTASAPYLATRCLKQIGLECGDKNVAEVILHDFYVDDLATGTDQLNEAHVLRRKVSDALASACMHLRKWKSNEPTLLPGPTDQTTFSFNKEGHDLNKILGLSWETHADELLFPINLPDKQENTKRNMLAVISRIFDPLGLLSPCIVRMKMLLQKLWLEGLKWDDQLTAGLATQWLNIIKTLPAIGNIRVPRRVVCDLYDHFEFHIFTDASERGYGACLYVRSINAQGDVTVHLLMAKSRVVPIKPTTVPRLELCAGVVGTRLYRKVVSSLRTQPKNVVFWTDSMIVLGWLKMLPIKLNTFVRNRVGEILQTTGSWTWRHVPSNDNPADLISRGIDPSTLHSLDLWWFGPSFLSLSSTFWPSTTHNSNRALALPEVKLIKDISLHAVCQNLNLIDFNRFSNYLRLVHTVCYVLRFIDLCKNERQSVHYSSFSPNELQRSLNYLIIQSQMESFPEYEILIRNQKLPHKNHLLQLNVFLDANKIIRIGGRLHNTQYSFEKKHPILLQSTHYFVKLLFRYEHVRLMHAGPQLLLTSMREIYWPLGGRNLARSSYRQCVRCRRLKGQTVVPQMGNLPLCRFSPADFPFQNVGVDYAGPILSVSRQGRGSRHVKVYIVIFICFTTKAIHLELVGDLTSSNYIQALRRFISRRGKPVSIYSDNGTAFVGAYNEISKFLKGNCDSISDSMAHEGILFHFIPAYAPHFGGLWEAGIKSTKFHLNRVLGNCNMTYEELNSVLIQIEAILNSRPLTPLSSNSEDLLPLTPGHFLIGRPLTSLPVKDLRDHVHHHLTRYQRIEQLRQHFWARWNKEYISELQLRVKWKTSKDSLKLNSLVVIKDDSLPALKWKLGRVVGLHEGHDGIARVADVRTATGVIRRAFSKICPLLDDSC